MLVRSLCTRALFPASKATPTVLFRAVTAEPKSHIRSTLRSLLQASPSLVQSLDASGLTALEVALQRKNVAAAKELLMFNAEITDEARRLAANEPELQAVLTRTKGERIKAKNEVRVAVKTHTKEPELTWTGSGFKVKDGSWDGYVRINRHRNYIASPALGKVNEMCRRGC